MSQQFFLICGPNEAGENFLKHLQQNDLSFVALAYNFEQQQRLFELRVQNIFLIPDTLDSFLVDIPIKKAFIFEDQTSECCRAIQFLSKFISKKKIYVITHNHRPMLIQVFKEMGAGCVICTHSNDMSFLIS